MGKGGKPVGGYATNFLNCLSYYNVSGSANLYLLSLQVLEISSTTVLWFQTENKQTVMVIMLVMRVITALQLTTLIRQVISNTFSRFTCV